MKAPEEQEEEEDEEEGTSTSQMQIGGPRMSSGRDARRGVCRNAFYECGSFASSSLQARWELHYDLVRSCACALSCRDVTHGVQMENKWRSWNEHCMARVKPL